jgi:hypothetical protein
VLKGAQLGTALGDIAWTIGVIPPSGCHLPIFVGVDESGQRGLSTLHRIPWGITLTEYFENWGVDLVQCGADAPFGVSVPAHSLPNDSVYHSAVKS